jgi:hypothetical protein
MPRGVKASSLLVVNMLLDMIVFNLVCKEKILWSILVARVMCLLLVGERKMFLSILVTYALSFVYTLVNL